MINSLSTYNSLINTTSTTGNSEVDTIIEQHQESNSEKVSTTDSNQSSLYLSNRAQRINAISNEFFTGDALDFDDVEALKERVYQLGLISKNEYEKLTNAAVQSENESSSDENSTVSLTNFLGDLLERLQNDDNESDGDDDSSSEEGIESSALTALIKALENAKDIISNVEEAKRETDFNSTLQATLAQLKETIETSAFEKLPLDDQIGISKVYQTLDIVDQLAPQRLNNEKINKYLDLSFS